MNPRSSHTHCQVAQADTQAKTWQRVCLPHPEKIELKKFPIPSEIKKYANAQPDTTKKETTKLNKDKGLQTRKTEGLLLTAVLQKWQCSALYDSEVVNQNLVLRLKFCAENRHLRKAAKRWQQA